jgi:hypothetical protein
VLFNRHAVILPSAHQSNTITCDSLSTRKWWYVVSAESVLKYCFRNVFQS